MTVVPSPSRLSSAILPPCSSINRRTRGRPSPVPGCARLHALAIDAEMRVIAANAAIGRLLACAPERLLGGDFAAWAAEPLRLLRRRRRALGRAVDLPGRRRRGVGVGLRRDRTDAGDGANATQAFADSWLDNKPSKDTCRPSLAQID